jgi:lactobin A/cerein 7B family class IIb bacteriocin
LTLGSLQAALHFFSSHPSRIFRQFRREKQATTMKMEIHEMTVSELEGVSGGVWPLFFASAAVGVAGYLANGIIEHWDDFKKGVGEGYNTFA